ncbi:UNVERIFIED_CONTAM: hypothetical protein GTU68_041957 [Idotea baltica]|nr:hypothetical protein [Idotea baltica]
MCLVITGVGSLIHMYAVGYMEHDKSRPRFFCYLNLFLFSMLMLVLGDSLLVMFVGWEGVGLCSYLLIGFWYSDDENAKAGQKAFVVNRIGDAGFLLGIFTLFGAFGTLNFESLNQIVSGASQINPLVIELACAFLFIGAMGKSAQIPLYVWLPDAMAGPTPVSALIHAATMVTAGVYMIARLGAVFTAAPMVSPGVLNLGVVGIIYGALVAWVQTDIKKLVAYSSVSHLGFCVLGFACLNIIGMQGSVMQMLNHGISTAALFFAVGVLYDRKHTREISDYQGLAKKVPVFSAVFLIFTLSSIGLPLTNGFVGEFLILLGTSQAFSLLLTALAVSGVILGAVYMLSLYRRTIFGELDEEKNGDLLDLNLREAMVFFPLILMVFFMGLYPSPILRDLEPATTATLETMRAKLDRVPQTIAVSDGEITEQYTILRPTS